LLKIIFKAEGFAIRLWIALYDYMKMYEWLVGVEYDVYHSVMYFLPYVDCEKLCEVVDLYGDIVGEWIYANHDDDDVGTKGVSQVAYWVLTITRY